MGDWSTALGNRSKAIGRWSLATGYNTEANGEIATARVGNYW